MKILTAIANTKWGHGQLFFDDDKSRFTVNFMCEIHVASCNSLCLNP